MKGARRTRKSRHQAGFADLMEPPHPTTSMRGVVTGVSRAQPTISTSNPATSNPTTPPYPTSPPNPTTPPPVDEDWGALLHITPKRRMSPQKPIIATSPNSSSPTHPSPTPTTSHPQTPSPQPAKAPSSSTSTPVPAFLSGWDGADGWGDDPSLDESDQEIQEDAWGAWPESDDILSSHPQFTSDTTPASQRPVETALDFGIPSASHPSSGQQPDPHVDLKTEQASNLSGEDPFTVPETSPTHPVEENDLLPDNELSRQPADTEPLKVEPDQHPPIPADDGALQNMEAAVEPADTGPLKDKPDQHPGIPAHDGVLENLEAAVEPVDSEPLKVEPDEHPAIPAGDEAVENLEAAVEPADAEPLKVEPDEHPGVSAGDGVLENLEAAVEVPQKSATHEILSEYNLVQTPVISPPEHATENSQSQEGVSGGDEQHSRVEIDFSGWNEVEATHEEAAEYPVPYTEPTQNVKESATEETKLHPGISVIDGVLENLEAAVEAPQKSATNEILSEDNPMQTPEISPPEHATENSQSQENVSGGDEQHSRVEIEFSGWNEVVPPPEAAHEEAAEFAVPYTEATQNVKESATEETNPRIEGQEDQNVLQDNAHQQADTFTPPETRSDNVALEGFEGADTEVHQDQDASLASAVVPQDKEVDTTPTQLPRNAWGFEESCKDAPVNDVGWGWGETENAPTANVEENEGTETSSAVKAATIPNDVTSESWKGNVQDRSWASGERISGQDKKDVSPPALRENLESKEENKGVNPFFVSMEPSTIAEDGWGFEENPKEANTDDWGWGAPMEDTEVEFTVDSSLSNDNANASLSVPEHDPSVQGSAYVSLHSIHRTGETQRTMDLPREEGDKSAGGGTADEVVNQKLQSVKGADDATSLDAPRSAEHDNSTATGAQKAGGTTHEVYDSFAVAGESTLNQHSQGDATIDQAVLGKTHSEYPNEDGPANSGAPRAIEENVWEVDVRSTDVEMSSTVAGTDVPSVAALSSVDEVDWEADRNDIGMNASNSSNGEIVKSAAAESTPSYLWGDHDRTSHTDRSWSNPDAMWSTPPADAQLPVTAEEEVTSTVVLGREEPVGRESASSKSLLPTESDPANVMIGIAEEASLQTAKDTSLPESTPYYPGIPQQNFEHFREVHTEPVPVTKGESYYRTEIQTAGVPEILGATKSTNTVEEPRLDQSALEVNIQSLPLPKQFPISENANSSLLLTDHGSNAYWTERLDESRSKQPDRSNDRSQTTSSEFLTTLPDESQMETQFAPPGRLKEASDNVQERDFFDKPKERNLATTPTQPVEPASAGAVCNVASSPTGNGENRQVPHPAPQVSPGWESSHGANLNGMMRVPTPAINTKAESIEMDRRNEAKETMMENGPTSTDDSQLFDATQSLQWRSEEFAVEDGDGSNYFESQEGYSVKNDSKAQSDASHRQEQVMEETRTVLPQDDDNSFSTWKQYAPRLTSTPANGPSSAPVSEVPPPPPAQPTPENQQSASKMETISYDTATYDPFAISHEDSAMEKAKRVKEAFDWGVEVQEPVRHAEMSMPAVSTVPQEASGVSPRTPQSRVPNETIAEQNPRQEVSSLDEVNQRPEAVKVQQDSHTSHPAETGGRDQIFGDQGVKSSEVELRTMSPYNQGRIIERGTQEYRMREHPNADILQDDLTPPVSQSPLNDVAGLDRYAPRGAQPIESGSSTHEEDLSSLVRQETFDNSIAYEDGGTSPYIPPSSGISWSDAPFPGGRPASPQSVHPVSSLPFESDVSKTAPDPPAQTPTSSAPGDMQSYQIEKGDSSSPVYEPAVTPELMHSDPLSMPRPPLPAAPDIAMSHVLTRETPDSSIPSDSKAERKDMSESITRYQEDFAVHETNSSPYAPAQSGSRQISPELGTEGAEFKQHSFPMHGVGEKPSGLSEPSWANSSSPYSPQAAYANVVGPSQGHDATGPKATFLQSQGSYGIAEEFTFPFAVPPPPQQAPLPPPSIATNQEAFPAESIIDPSTFAYPYSILDTETSGDVSYRPQRPLISWGFGGKLVTVIPPRSTTADGRLPAEVKGSSTVHIHDLTDIAQDGSNDDWAAASEAVAPLSLPVRPPDLLIYADMCDRLSKLSVGLSGSEAEGRAALWRILALLCRQGTSDWRINASTAISGPSSVPMFGRSNSSSFVSGKAKCESPLRESELGSGLSDREKSDAAAEVERLLTLGNGVEAIRVAQESGLWSIALVLAATVDKSLYMKTVSEFAKSTLQDGSALQTLCLSTAEDDAEILRKATSSSGLKEWRKTVGMLLTTHRTSFNTGDRENSKFLGLIDQIGEALIAQRNDVLAGHVCFLLSGRLGPLNSTNIPLLGADPKLPSGRPRSMGSPAVALQSLVLEAVANAQSGSMYPHILPFRLLLAEEICAVGRPDIALAHCESMSCAVREVFQSGRKDLAAKFFTLPFLSHLESLEQRLRVHLGLQESGGRKGGLSALGKSLSSVFTRSSTVDSRDIKPASRDVPAQFAPFSDSRESPQLQSVPLTSASTPSPAVSSDNHPHMVTEPQWTAQFDPSKLQPLPVDRSSQGVPQDKQSGDVSGKERWNSIVSKTIGFIAPAEGDLSPPLKARGDQGVPFHAQPSPLGLGNGTGSRAPSHDVHVGHMRSASVGDVPIMRNHDPMAQGQGMGTYSHGALQPPHSPTGHRHDLDGKPADVSNFNVISVKKATTAESGAAATHRRSASDMTFETQTSEKKPPRPPKKPPGLPPGVELQQKKENAPAIKGWRSRLSEKIRAAFSGPPRAHMGVENKFRYDKEKGRWIMDGEDPIEDDNIPPPPPDDDAMQDQKVPFSQSYESLPNPDLGNQFVPHSKAANSQGADDVPGGAMGASKFRRYSYNAQLGYNTSVENANSKDTGSESSVASAASAPVPFSSQPAIAMSANVGNKFRAQPGRLSGRRAYVDTFNKGMAASSMPAPPHTARPGVPGMPAPPHAARPGVPGMPGLSSSGASGYRIFTPNPAAVGPGGLSAKDSNGQGEGPPGRSSIVESSDQGPEMRQETQTNIGQQSGDPFGYGVSKPAPMPSVEQYQSSMRNERQPRLMA